MRTETLKRCNKLSAGRKHRWQQRSARWPRVGNAWETSWRRWCVKDQQKQIILVNGRLGVLCLWKCFLLIPNSPVGASSCFRYRRCSENASKWRGNQNQVKKKSKSLFPPIPRHWKVCGYVFYSDRCAANWRDGRECRGRTESKVSGRFLAPTSQLEWSLNYIYRGWETKNYGERGLK